MVDTGATYITVTPNGPVDGGNFGPSTPGTTTSGIQEALNALDAQTAPYTGIYTLWIRAGTYAITSQIVFPPRIRVIGDHYQTFLQNSGGTLTAPFVTDSSRVYYQGALLGLTFDGQNTTGYVLTITDAYDCDFDVSIINGANGISNQVNTTATLPTGAGTADVTASYQHSRLWKVSMMNVATSGGTAMLWDGGTTGGFMTNNTIYHTIIRDLGTNSIGIDLNERCDSFDWYKTDFFVGATATGVTLVRLNAQSSNSGVKWHNFYRVSATSSGGTGTAFAFGPGVGNVLIHMMERGSAFTLYSVNGTTSFQVYDTSDSEWIAFGGGAVDQRTGVTAADGSATTLITSVAGQGWSVQGVLDATAYTSGTATYTISWTNPSGQARSKGFALSASGAVQIACNVFAKAGTAIKGQLTGTFTATLDINVKVLSTN